MCQKFAGTILSSDTGNRNLNLFFVYEYIVINKLARLNIQISAATCMFDSLWLFEPHDSLKTETV